MKKLIVYICMRDISIILINMIAFMLLLYQWVLKGGDKSRSKVQC